MCCGLRVVLDPVRPVTICPVVVTTNATSKHSTAQQLAHGDSLIDLPIDAADGPEALVAAVGAVARALKVGLAGANAMVSAAHEDEGCGHAPRHGLRAACCADEDDVLRSKVARSREEGHRGRGTPFKLELQPAREQHTHHDWWFFLATLPCRLSKATCPVV